MFKKRGGIVIIKISNAALSKIIEKYIEEIIPKISKKLLEEKAKTYDGSGCILPLRVFFVGDNVNVALLTDILTKPISELKVEHEWINKYMADVERILALNSLKESIKKATYKLKNAERISIRKQELAKLYDVNSENYFASDKAFKSEKNFNTEIDRIIDKLNEPSNSLKATFNYDFISSGLRNEILVQLGADVCPYCNRQYISNYTYSGNRKTTADLDHFYPKDIYPLFSLCLHNFIPSCKICNSLFKLAKSEPIIYPYEEEYGDDAYFVANSDDVSTLLGFKTNAEVVVAINPTLKNEDTRRKIENHKKLFRIEELYNSHSQFIAEILFKKQIYTDSFFEMVERKIDIKLTQSDIELLVYGCKLDKECFTERPFSKIIYDLVKR